MEATQFRQSSIRKASLVIHSRPHRERKDNLHERFEIKGISHQAAYSINGACTHLAETYLPCRRSAGTGIQHHIAASYLLGDAKESSWRKEIAAGMVSRSTRLPHGAAVERGIVQDGFVQDGFPERIRSASLRGVTWAAWISRKSLLNSKYEGRGASRVLLFC